MACPTCKDIGWVETPYYSDFEPTTRPTPCPECNTEAHHGQIGAWFWFVVFTFIAVVLLAMVTP